jgi:transposase-like protein
LALLSRCTSTSQPRKYGVTAREQWLHGSCIDDAEKTGRTISGSRRRSRGLEGALQLEAIRECRLIGAGSGSRATREIDTEKHLRYRRRQYRNRDLSTVAEARTASVSVNVEMIGARRWRVTSVTHTHPCKNGSTASRPGSRTGAMMQEAGESSRRFLE